MRLEDLQTAAALRGVLPDALVTVVSVQWFGSEAVELTYKTAAGAVANELLFRDDEARLEIVERGRPWSFDGDGALFRLVSEAQRIRLAHLFDPVLAVHTSDLEPLPHQITAVYEAMLPRQHRLVDGGDLVRQRFEIGCVDRQHGIEEMRQPDALRLGHQAKQRAIAVEAPRAAALDDLEPSLVVAEQKLVRDRARRRLVGQLDRLGAEPLHADDGDERVGEHAAEGGSGLEILESHDSTRFSAGHTLDQCVAWRPSGASQRLLACRRAGTLSAGRLYRSTRRLRPANSPDAAQSDGRRCVLPSWRGSAPGATRPGAAARSARPPWLARHSGCVGRHR